MNPKRIAKMCSSLLGAQGVTLLNQFLLPPLFLKSYGVSAYGEWLTLSAAISYLGTLNFGLQTFANNQAGIAYNRGELKEVNALQDTALLILLVIVVAASVVTSGVFLIPVASWLKLELPNRDAALIVYLLGMQILVRMLFGFFTGCFLVIGMAHRGQNWNNGLSAATVALTAGAALLHLPFHQIALVQLILVLLFSGISLLDLGRLGPAIVPRLRNAQVSRIREILGPSGYFAMLFSSNFLVYQLPVLVMSRLLGPATVVIFSLSRTIYSMSRNLLNAVSQALGPEIVELYGAGKWDQLHQLYDLSERAVFALTPVISLGTFAFTPILIQLWLHRPALYEPYTCFYMALISAVMGIKEHKYVFQTSANEHSAMSRFVFGTYLAMVIASVPIIKVFALNGFLLAWLATELAQLFYILELNKRLFSTAVRLDMKPVYRLCALLVVAFGACFVVSRMFATWSDRGPLSLTFAALLASTIASYYLFGVKELHAGLASRLFRKA